MKIDAHYYALLAFCRLTGFKKDTAHKIAFASQFVDDAKLNQVCLSPNNDSSILNFFKDNYPPLFNMATSHSYFKINTLNYSSMINNTSAFHFVPGCDGINFAKKMRCKEESPIIMDILDKAKRDNDPVKLGMVLHAYADTFVHQGFSGVISKVNDIRDQRALYDSCEGFIEKISIYGLNNLSERKSDSMPAYGHGQAYHFPDIPYLIWQYAYDSTGNFSKDYKLVKINNTKRYQLAFRKIKVHLEDYLSMHPEFKDEKTGNHVCFDEAFYILTAKSILKLKIKKWQQFIVRENLLNRTDIDLLQYEEDTWLKEAFTDFDYRCYKERSVNDAVLAEDFIKSNWYRFYDNVKWYKERYFACAQKNGLVISR